MKKKRFYKNAKRNQVWTEEEKGRKIDFSDKYIYSETYSDKYDYLRPKPARKKYFNKHRVSKFFKRLGAAVLAFAIVSFGYMCMDVYMQRHAMPAEKPEEDIASEAPLNEIALDLQAEYVSNVSFDGGAMLDSVITELEAGGYDSAAVDIKRAEGTIGYRSALANVDTFGAVAFPANDLKGSAEKLAAEDIMAIGIVSCYLDNLVPAQSREMAVTRSNGTLYMDSRDNTYLNPDSELTYNYIKGIIGEAYDLGITVFVLSGTELPSELSGEYGDGFDKLSARLYKDLGTDIKFLKPVYASLKSAADSEELDGEIAEKINTEPQSDSICYITTQSDKEIIKQKLEEQGAFSYILAN